VDDDDDVEVDPPADTERAKPSEDDPTAIDAPPGKSTNQWSEAVSIQGVCTVPDDIRSPPKLR
jgi:hypothetical protein